MRRIRALADDLRAVGCSEKEVQAWAVACLASYEGRAAAAAEAQAYSSFLSMPAHPPLPAPRVKPPIAARLSPLPARTDEPAGRGSQSSHIGLPPRPPCGSRPPAALGALALLGQAWGEEVLVGSAVV